MIIYIIIIIIIIVCILLYQQRSTFMNVFNKPKYTAVIVEPRIHKALEYVLDNFLKNLSNDWGILIMHGNLNKDYVKNMIDNNLSKYKYRLSTYNLKVNNLTIDEYNKLLVSRDFYNNIQTETFLIFQTDTIICSKFKNNINDFIKYDYVGAPWKNGGVGNGGLSLRKKSKMIEIINKCPYTGINEDVYFSSSCKDVIINKPTDKNAMRFSIEQVYNPNSFGIHKAYGWLNGKELTKVKSFCPEINNLIELNK